MRYVMVKKLKKGMELACNLYNEKLEPAFKAGQKLKPAHIDQITKAGYLGAYISDNNPYEVTPDILLPEDMYMNVVRAYKMFVERAEAAGRGGASAVASEEQRKVIMPVVGIMLAKRRLIVDTVDLKPFAGYDYYHAVNVMILSLLVGVKLKLNENQLYELGLSALLHDIGNAFVPKELLNRPGTLTDEEFDIIRNHVQVGFNYLRENFDISDSACMAAMQHHENYDGTGYPNKLKRKSISLYGRIISVADVYDALVSKRMFRHAMNAVQALEVVQQKSDRKFDPDIVEALENIIAPYPTGVLVRLKTGETCLVVRNYDDDLKRPRLQLTENEQPKYSFIDLHSDPGHAKNRVVKVMD